MADHAEMRAAMERAMRSNVVVDHMPDLPESEKHENTRAMLRYYIGNSKAWEDRAGTAERVADALAEALIARGFTSAQIDALALYESMRT